MTIDEAEKAFIEALDKSMGNLFRGDWYKRKTVRMAFRKGWERAIEEMKVNNCNTPAVSVNEVEVCPKCHDRGWIYSDDGSTRTVCPCHY